MAPGFSGCFHNSPKNPPAVSTADKNGANRILAMDRVYVDNPTILAAYVNHGAVYEGAAGNSRFMPKFVNVLFGDGHVEGRAGIDHYKTPWLESSTASMGHSSVDSWFWWGN